MKKPQFIARQGRTPSGLLGAVVARIMSKETAAANDAAIALLNVQPGDRVLDAGTGHGAALGTLATLNSPGSLDGIDLSRAALKVAKQKNRSLLKAGRLHLTQGVTDDMPYADQSFDKILSMHTIYFWRDAAAHLKEIFRVLAPGGGFVIGFRPGEDPCAKATFPENIYTFRTIAEVTQLLEATGFHIQETKQQKDRKTILCWVVAKRSIR